MKKYMCVDCGFIYDEEIGLSAHGIAPGTLWSDIPDGWKCPDCDLVKSDFILLDF